MLPYSEDYYEVINWHFIVSTTLLHYQNDFTDTKNQFILPTDEKKYRESIDNFFKHISFPTDLDCNFLIEDLLKNIPACYENEAFLKSGNKKETIDELKKYVAANSIFSIYKDSIKEYNKDFNWNSYEYKFINEMFKYFETKALFKIENINQNFNNEGKAAISNYDLIIYKTVNKLLKITNLNKGNIYSAIEELFSNIYSKEFKDGNNIKAAYGRGKSKSERTT